MATSNADRQRAYRQRHLKSDASMDERLNTLVSRHAKFALARLAQHHETTQRAVLERLIVDTERAAVDGMTAKEEKAYYAVTA